MRKILALFIGLSFLLSSLFLTVSSVDAATKVKGYIKPKTGTYVKPHYRTSPDKSKLNNYSTKGNYNPYTGKKGTVDPFKPKIRSRY